MIVVNNILKRVCKLNGLGFIDNSNICAETLFEDGLHLNDDGKVILANNFVCFKYVYFMTHKKFVMALVRMILYSTQIFIATMVSLPLSQIVLK